MFAAFVSSDIFETKSRVIQFMLLVDSTNACCEKSEKFKYINKKLIIAKNLVFITCLSDYLEGI